MNLRATIFLLSILTISCHQKENLFETQFQILVTQMQQKSVKLFGKYPTDKPGVQLVDPALPNTTYNVFMVSEDASKNYRATIIETKSKSESIKAFKNCYKKINSVLDSNFKRHYNEIPSFTGNTIRTYFLTSQNLNVELSQSRSELDNKYRVTLHVSSK